MRKSVKYSLGAFCVLLAFISALALSALFYSRKPHVRFVLNMADIIEPSDFREEEIHITARGVSVPVMKYGRPGTEEERYMVLLHGRFHQGHVHEKSPPRKVAGNNAALLANN